MEGIGTLLGQFVDEHGRCAAVAVARLQIHRRVLRPHVQFVRGVYDGSSLSRRSVQSITQLVGGILMQSSRGRAVVFDAE